MKSVPVLVILDFSSCSPWGLAGFKGVPAPQSGKETLDYGKYES